MAMDSKAVFAQRVGELGLGSFSNEFTAKGWDTHGNFAFASTYVPGAADDSKFVDQVVVPLLAAADHVNEAAERRAVSKRIRVADPVGPEFKCMMRMNARAHLSIGSTCTSRLE